MMGSQQVRRCLISCQVHSMHVMGEIIACNAFTSLNKKPFAIYFMAAAYNTETKDARIYAEFERVSKRVIDHQLQTMGAGSVVIDSFSSRDWKMASEAAFNSVIECGAKPGYSFQERGDHTHHHHKQQVEITAENYDTLEYGSRICVLYDDNNIDDTDDVPLPSID